MQGWEVRSAEVPAYRVGKGRPASMAKLEPPYRLQHLCPRLKRGARSAWRSLVRRLRSCVVDRFEPRLDGVERVVLLLVANVALDGGQVVERDAERAIAILPAEARSRGDPVRDCMRRGTLDFSRQAGN